jgi:S1-C subfamily serine protease
MQSARSLEKRLQGLYQRVSPAIVRFSLEENGEHSGSTPGVVVSADGFIVTASVGTVWDARKQKGPIFCLLFGGRIAKCKGCGWSKEWQVAVLKITDPGPWPHVKLDDRTEIPAGETYAAFHYARQPDQRQFEQRPQMRIGSILHSSPPLWFTTSSVDGFSPVFSLDGRLVGITTNIPVRYEAACTPASLILKHWTPLTDGANLDRELLAVGRSAPSAARPETDSSDHSDASTVKAAIDNAASATVRIRRAGEKNGWSGVIVTPDGYVATCAHHYSLPGDRVAIELSDGRDTQGKMLGSDRIADVALVKITDPGQWPNVELGNSVATVADQHCWLIGYPATHKERTPLVRKSSIAERDDLLWSHLLSTSKPVEVFGGDSGGGMFDSRGRLLGCFQGPVPAVGGAEYLRVELFRQEWDLLSAEKPVAAASGPPLGHSVNVFSKVAQRLSNFTVEILSDDKLCALGTVVGCNGRVLTKASELYGAIFVRLPDGRSLPATIQKYSRPLDLALLAVAADDLPSADVRSNNALLPGTLIATLIPSENPRVGAVCCETRAIPVDRGAGLSNLSNSANGLEVTDDKPARELGIKIRKGDVVRRIEGHDTPNLKSILALLGDGDHPGSLVTNAGDPIAVTVERDGKTIDLRFPRPPAEWWALNAESRRHAGFPAAFDIDVPLDAVLCGGPVIDIDGRVVGIAIAARGNEWHTTHSHVLPAAAVRAFIEN